VISPGAELAVLFGIAIVAGTLGALLGLGGGIIIVPALTLLLGVRIHDAIGASIVSVIATSSGAAAAYIRDRVTNVRVGLFLEVGAVAGAILGALLASIVSGRFLYALFAVVIAYSAFTMLRRRPRRAAHEVPPDVLADRLQLHGRYFDHVLGQLIEYRVSRVVEGLLLMMGAGVASGLLGIGSGILKVPALDMAMRIPIKASSATSNFMIGLTAAASAALYFSRGDVKPFLAGPIAVGVVAGAMLGARLLPRVPEVLIRRLFVVVLVVVAVEMAQKALQ
jgi:uncharacterized membrane protein YfcA